MSESTVTVKNLSSNISAKVSQASSVNATVSTRGPQGPIGSTGLTGSTGPQGVVGATGSTGPSSFKPFVTVGFSDADYICDGVADDVQIQAAIDYAQPIAATVYIKPGTYNLLSHVKKDADNIAIVGAGMGKTILVNQIVTDGYSMIDIGNGPGPTVRKNIHIEGITFDLNSQDNTWGLFISWCANITVRDCYFKNPSTTSYSQLFVGLFSNMSATWDTNNITIDNCTFDYGNVTRSWEAVTLGYARDVRLTNCRFLNKPGSTPLLLNYHSEEVSVSNCYFYRGSFVVNGRGPTHISSTKFEGGPLKIAAANNVIVDDCSFLGTVADALASRTVGVTIAGLHYPVDANEYPFYITLPFTWNCKNINITNSYFEGCNSYAVSAGQITSNSVAMLSLDSLILNGNTFVGSYLDGVHLVASYASINGNIFKNSSQSGNSGTKNNIFIAASYAVVGDNQSYDDQSVATTTRDLVIDTTPSLITASVFYVSNNNFLITSNVINFYTGSFTTTNPGTVTLSGNYLPSSGGTLTGALTINSTSATALQVGANGATDPQFVVRDSVASTATGIRVSGNAAGSWANINTLSSGTNETLSIDAKGTGTIRLQTNGGTGIITLGQRSEVSSTSSTAFTVGPNGATSNQTLKVDSSTSSAATGLNIKAAAATAGIALSAISTGADENMTINAKGAGTLTLNGTATGGITLGQDTTITDAKNIALSGTTGTKIGTATTQKLAFYNATPVVQQTDGAALTNSVTSGGTTDTIANYTDLTIYANDSTAIRNNMYQLARKIKIIDDALRTYGLLS